jgi:hypothetical protein
MANHRATDGTARRYTVLDSTDRMPFGSHPSPRTVTARTTAVPAPRTALTARPRTVPGAPERRHAPEPVTAVVAGPARRSDPADLRGATAQRSSSDDIEARATTTLIPNSPGDRAKAGPVFVDGSGRRARRFKGLAVAAATLAAGYVGVVVTGALAGATGPVGGGPAPVASGASLAPAPAVPAVVPSPIVATPADVTTKATAPTTKRPSTAKKVVPRTTTPRKVVPAPVVPPPAAPVTPAVPAPTKQAEPPVEVPKDQQPEQKEPAAVEKSPALKNT